MSRLSKNAEARITLRLNGETVSALAEPRMLLSDFLRHALGATGTHVGCEHGVCGACTVQINGRVARSCLTLAVQAAGCDVATIEGMTDAAGELGIIQRAFREHFALQCGFCTPGIVMSLADYLATSTVVDEAEIRDVVAGHLCRCTGYAPIVAAALAAAREILATRERENDAR